MGFQNGTKGFFILDLGTKEIFFSRNVIFHETIFFFLSRLLPLMTTNWTKYLFLEISYFMKWFFLLSRLLPVMTTNFLLAQHLSLPRFVSLTLAHCPLNPLHITHLKLNQKWAIFFLSFLIQCWSTRPQYPTFSISTKQLNTIVSCPTSTSLSINQTT